MDIPAIHRATIHALELAAEDCQKWCGALDVDELNAAPHGLPPVAFHLRHISGSLDRLLTYAEGHQLSEEQLAALQRERSPVASGEALWQEFRSALENSATRVRAFAGQEVEAARKVGKRALPTCVGSLLVHVADHTQRHVGQAITTAKVVMAMRPIVP